MLEEDEEMTCCHRATICSPVLREMIVTKPVTRFCERLTWAKLFFLTTMVGLAVLAWTVLFFLLGDTMLPDGGGFGLYTLILLSYSLGWSLTYIPYLNLPPVFGMLLSGIVYRNTGFYDIHEQLGRGTTSKIRTICLTFIMIRAGLQLTTTALSRNMLFMLIIVFLPSTIELAVLTLCCRYILNYPKDWSFMAGTIVASMSPVVTVNCMLALAERGYGEDKGLPTLLCTAASIENVYMISLFAVGYSAVFADDEGRSEWWSYIPGFLRDVLLGVSAGSTLGLFLIFFPHRSHRYATLYRMVGLILGSLTCTSAVSVLAISGGGYLATVIMSFISITGWKILSASYDSASLRDAAYYLWHLMQPVLLGVIGADIDVRNWSASRFGLHVFSIAIGLTVRCTTAFLTTLRSSFSWKERFFVAIAWLPKGTIQAALAPMAFERARIEADSERMKLALDLLRISVVAIIFLAPLGAFAMTISGPLLLNKVTIEEHQRERELSYLRIISMQPVRTRRTKDVPPATA